MPTTVRCTSTIAAPASRVFALVSDYRSATAVIEGLEEMTPDGPKSAGEGASFDAVIQLGPRRVRARVRIAKLAHDASITWASSGGDDRSLTFDLHSKGPDSTEVTLTVSYNGPGGLSGLVLAPVVEQNVRSRARRSLERLSQLSLESSRA